MVVEMTEAQREIIAKNLLKWQATERVRRRNEKQQRRELARERQRLASLRGGVRV